MINVNKMTFQRSGRSKQTLVKYPDFLEANYSLAVRNDKDSEQILSLPNGCSQNIFPNNYSEHTVFPGKQLSGVSRDRHLEHQQLQTFL